MSVALVEPDPEGGYLVRTAALGETVDRGEPVDEDTVFGSASVAKVLPGMLLADMVDRGEVGLDTTVGEPLPGLGPADPAIDDITLAELATPWPRGPVPTTRASSGSGSSNPWAW